MPEGSRRRGGRWRVIPGGVALPLALISLLVAGGLRAEDGDPFGAPPMGLAQLERVQAEPPPQRCVPASAQLPPEPLAIAGIAARGDRERLQRALAHYQADHLCLLPTLPPTPYLLVAGEAPRGVMMGEGCSLLRREDWALQPAPQGLALVEDGQPLLAFAGEEQALRTLGVLDWYGFGWRCQARAAGGRILYFRR